MSDKRGGLMSNFRNDNPYPINSNVNIAPNNSGSICEAECRCKYSTIFQAILLLLVLYSCALSTYNFITKIDDCNCPTDSPTISPTKSPTKYGGGTKLFMFPSSKARFHVKFTKNMSNPINETREIDLSGYDISDNARAIHATVYISRTASKYFALVMGTLPLCTRDSCALWSDPYGSFFYGNESYWDNSDNVMLHYSQNTYTSEYGIQYTSLTIPITSDKKVYWTAISGKNNDDIFYGGFILFIRGYYAP